MKYLVWCKDSLNHSFMSSAKNFEHPHSPLIVLCIVKRNPVKSSGCPVQPDPSPPPPPPPPSPSADPTFEELPWSLAAVYQAFLRERRKREDKKGEGKNTLSLCPFTEGLILRLMLPVKFIRPSAGHDAFATIHQQRRNNNVHYIIFRVSPSSII